MRPRRNFLLTSGEPKTSRFAHNRPIGLLLDQAAELVGTVCRVAGVDYLIGDDTDPQTRRLREAIAAHETPYIFGRLVEAFSFQGISDHAACSYMDKHGRLTWQKLRLATAYIGPCSKLGSYWSFHGCGYRKSGRICAEPKLISLCSLPGHNLRNGRLNQTAYSLFLFIRDVMGGDPVEWIDQALGKVSVISGDNRPRELRNALIGQLRNIFGVSSKVLNMTLADILLAAPPNKPMWLETGFSMIAVDTLVHNFLHRTGIMQKCGARHAYGPNCYAKDGCADVIGQIATRIIATQFNATYPVTFPRFVQHAIWRYCAQYGLGICNGNTIDDRNRCANDSCHLFQRCERVTLNPVLADSG